MRARLRYDDEGRGPPARPAGRHPAAAPSRRGAASVVSALLPCLLLSLAAAARRVAAQPPSASQQPAAAGGESCAAVRLVTHANAYGGHEARWRLSPCVTGAAGPVRSGPFCTAVVSGPGGAAAVAGSAPRYVGADEDVLAAVAKGGGGGGGSGAEPTDFALVESTACDEFAAASAAALGGDEGALPVAHEVETCLPAGTYTLQMYDEGRDGWTGSCARFSAAGECLREYVAVDVWADAPEGSEDGQPVQLLARAGENFVSGGRADATFEVPTSLLKGGGDDSPLTIGAGMRLSITEPDADGAMNVTLDAPLPREVKLLKLSLKVTDGATAVAPVVLNATGGVAAEVGMALQPAGSQLVISGLGAVGTALPSGASGLLVRLSVDTRLAGQSVCASGEALGVDQKDMVVSVTCRDGSGEVVGTLGGTAAFADEVSAACHAELALPPPSFALRQPMLWDAAVDIGGEGCRAPQQNSSSANAGGAGNATTGPVPPAGKGGDACECVAVCDRVRTADASPSPRCYAACTDDGSMAYAASLGELRAAMLDPAVGAIALTDNIELDRDFDGEWLGVAMGPSAVKEGGQLPFFALPQLTDRALAIVGRCGADGLSPCVLDGKRRAGIFLVGPDAHLTLHNIVLQNAMLTNAGNNATDGEALAAMSVASGGPALSLVISGSAWLSSVTVRHNRGVNGGAVAINGQDMHFTCETCEMYGNWALEAFRAAPAPSGAGGAGGALGAGAPQAPDATSAAACSLYVPSNGGALWASGPRNSIALANSIFLANKAWFTGGAVFIEPSSEETSLVVDGSTFLDNYQQGTEEGIDTLSANPICGGGNASAQLVSTWNGGVGVQPRDEVDVFITSDRVTMTLSPWSFGQFDETPINAPGLEWKSVVAGAPAVRAYPAVQSSQVGSARNSGNFSDSQVARALTPESHVPYVTLLPLPRFAAREQAAAGAPSIFQQAQGGQDGPSGWCASASPGTPPPLSVAQGVGGSSDEGWPCVVRIAAGSPAFEDPGAAATKWLFGDRSHLVTVSTNYSGDNTNVGLYLFEYDAVDTDGAVAASAYRWLVVEDGTPPVAGNVNWAPFVTDPQKFAVTWRGFEDPESSIVSYEWGVGSEPHENCTRRGDAQATCPDVRAFDSYSSSVGDECECRCVDPTAASDALNATSQPELPTVPCDPLPPVLSSLKDGCTCPPSLATQGKCAVEYTCVHDIWKRTLTELGDGGTYHGIVRAWNAYGKLITVSSPGVLVDATPPAIDEALAGSVRCGPFCAESDGDDSMASLSADVQAERDSIVCCWPDFADAPRSLCAGCKGSGLASVSVELIERSLNQQQVKSGGEQQDGGGAETAVGAVVGTASLLSGSPSAPAGRAPSTSSDEESLVGGSGQGRVANVTQHVPAVDDAVGNGGGGPNGSVARAGYSVLKFKLAADGAASSGQPEGVLQRSLRDAHSYSVKVVARDLAGNVAPAVLSTKPAVIDVQLPPQGSRLVVFASELPTEVGAQQIWDPPPAVALVFPTAAEMDQLVGPYFARASPANASACETPSDAAENSCFVAVGIGGRREEFVTSEFVPISALSSSGGSGIGSASTSSSSSGRRGRRLLQQDGEVDGGGDAAEENGASDTPGMLPLAFNTVAEWCAAEPGCFGVATMQDLVVAGPTTNGTFALTFDMSDPAYNVRVEPASSPTVQVRECLDNEVLSLNAGFPWCEPVKCGTGAYLNTTLRNETSEAAAGGNASLVIELVQQNACVQCPTGTASANATNNTACAPCEPGTFAASISFGACTPCPQGTYQPTDGEDECVACPEGSTTLGLGAASVDECRCKASFYNERQFQAGEGNVTDAVCLLGFDSSKVNLDDLSLCGAPPEDLDAVVTASAPCPLACPFQDGALCVRCAAPASCLQCPEGGSCAGFEQLSPTLAVDGAPKNLAGYWGDPRFPTTFYTCKEDRCDSDFSCFEGYAGTMCEACADGYSRVVGECLRCSPAWYVGEALLIPLIVVAWVGLNLLSLSSPGLGLMMNFFQKVAVLLVFDVVWPSTLGRIFNALSFFAFSVSFVTPGCIFGGWSAQASFFVQAMLPVAAAILYFGRHAAIVLWHSRQQGRLRTSYTALARPQPGQTRAQRAEQHARRAAAHWRIVLLQRRFDRSLDLAIAASSAFCAQVLVAMLVVGLAPIPCRGLANGDNVLRQMPTISCSSSLRDAMLGVGVVMLAVTLGMLAWFLWVLHAHRMRTALEDVRYKRRFGWLYDRYTFGTLLWEGKVAADKVALVALGILLPNSAWQLYIAIAVATVSLGVHLLATPFIRDLYAFNYVEGIYLWAFAQILLAGFIFENEDFFGSGIRTFAEVYTYVFLASGLVVAGVSVVYDLRRVHLASRAATDVITHVGKISERLRAMSGDAGELSSSEGAVAALVWPEEGGSEEGSVRGTVPLAASGAFARASSSRQELLGRLDAVSGDPELGGAAGTSVASASSPGSRERLGYAMLRRPRRVLHCLPAGERVGLEDRVHQRYVIYPQDDTFATFLKPGIANAWARDEASTVDPEESKLVFDVMREVDTEMRRSRGLNYYSGSMDSYLLDQMVQANPALLDFVACADQASVDDFRHFFLAFSSYYRCGGFDPVSSHIVSGQKYANFVAVMLTLDERSRHMVAYAIRVLDASRRSRGLKGRARACATCLPHCGCCGALDGGPARGDAAARPGGARGGASNYALHRAGEQSGPSTPASPGLLQADQRDEASTSRGGAGPNGEASSRFRSFLDGGDEDLDEKKAKGKEKKDLAPRSDEPGVVISPGLPNLGLGNLFGGGAQWHGVDLAHAADTRDTLGANIRSSHKRAVEPSLVANHLRPSGKGKTPGISLGTSSAATQAEGVPGVRIIPGRAAGSYRDKGKGKAYDDGGKGKVHDDDVMEFGNPYYAAKKGGGLSPLPMATPPHQPRMSRVREEAEEEQQRELRAKLGIPDSVNVCNSTDNIEQAIDVASPLTETPGSSTREATPVASPAMLPSGAATAAGLKATARRGGDGSVTAPESSASAQGGERHRATFRDAGVELRGERYASAVVRELEEEGVRSRERMVGAGSAVTIPRGRGQELHGEGERSSAPSRGGGGGVPWYWPRSQEKGKQQQRSTYDGTVEEESHQTPRQAQPVTASPLGTVGASPRGAEREEAERLEALSNVIRASVSQRQQRESQRWRAAEDARYYTKEARDEGPQ